MDKNTAKRVDRGEYYHLVKMAMNAGRAVGGLLGMVLLVYVGFTRGDAFLKRLTHASEFFNAILGSLLGLCTGFTLGTLLGGYIGHLFIKFSLSRYRKGFKERHGEDI
jgi:hypothetical protein